MCLIAFAWDTHPDYKLVMVANRDEFYARPTAAAHPWDDHPHIVGGRDLQAGGSWMLMGRSGRLAAVTNYRDLTNLREDATSRGEIPTNFLLQEQAPSYYLSELQQKAHTYNGFNVLVSDLKNMAHFSNYEGTVTVLPPGIYGLSNALLDTPWPKVQRAKLRLENLLEKDLDHHALLEMMADTQLAEDHLLPRTGVSPEWEKALSAMCIRTENYGTCSTSVITVSRAGEVHFIEKSYPVGSRTEQTKRFNWKIA